MHRFLILSMFSMAVGCENTNLTKYGADCGEGTTEIDGECVPNSAPGGGTSDGTVTDTDDGTDTDEGTDTDVDTDTGDSTSDDTATDDRDPGSLGESLSHISLPF